MYYVPGDGGYYSTFLEDFCQSWGLDVVALGFGDEASSKWIFQRLHDAVMVSKQGLILVKGPTAKGLAPTFGVFP